MPPLTRLRGLAVALPPATEVERAAAGGTLLSSLTIRTDDAIVEQLFPADGGAAPAATTHPAASVPGSSFSLGFTTAAGIREKEIGGSGGSIDPPGPLLTHLHTIYMAYSKCLPTRLNPLAERTCFSQAGVFSEAELAKLEVGPPVVGLSMIHRASVHFTPYTS
jgi:hypothetical protein